MKLAFTLSDMPGHMNTTLRALSAALMASGLRPVGAVQINAPSEPDAQGDMDLFVLPDGPRICISQSLGSGSSGCRLNAESLEQAVHRSGQRLAEGADILIVNKFGNHESDGRGFRDLIGAALMDGVPVVVGMTSDNLPAFEEFAAGLADQVSCDLPSLEEWCRAALADSAG